MRVDVAVACARQRVVEIHLAAIDRPLEQWAWWVQGRIRSEPYNAI
jgi:hypothetical protein